MAIWVSFGDILHVAGDKIANGFLVRGKFSGLRAATAFLFCVSLTSEKTLAEETSNRSAGPINPSQQEVKTGGPVHRFVHGRIQHENSTGINEFNTIVSVPGGPTQAVDWEAEYEINDDGSCDVVDLGTYDITSQPKLGKLTVKTGETAYLGWARCPAGPYTVNILYFTPLSAASIGNSQPDSFSYTWTACDDGCVSGSDTLYDEIATITAPSSLWWFGGINPDSTTFPVSVQVNVDIGQGTFFYSGPFNWHLISGSDAVKFTWPYGNDPQSASYNAVQTIAAAPPNSPNDVSIELGLIINDVFGNPVDMRTPPISLSVLEPYRTEPDSRNPYCPASKQPTYGYDCQIIYATYDQNGTQLPPASLPINENFTSNKINVISNNWVGGTACGSTGQCNPVKNAGFWEDELETTATPKYTTSNVCTASTCVPQPTSPTVPLGSSLVQYWHGEWWFGSTTPGQGILFQKNDWDEFIDHGSHEHVLTGSKLPG